MNTTKLKKYLLAFIILISVILLTYINDTYFRIYFIEYNSELRLFDHFIAGLSIPIILYLILGNFYGKCKFYFLWCTVWELQQFLQRDYFQFDQYFFDLLGIGLAIITYKKLIIKGVYDK